LGHNSTATNQPLKPILLITYNFLTSHNGDGFGRNYQVDNKQKLEAILSQIFQSKLNNFML